MDGDRDGRHRSRSKRYSSRSRSRSMDRYRSRRGHRSSRSRSRSYDRSYSSRRRQSSRSHRDSRSPSRDSKSYSRPLRSPRDDHGRHDDDYENRRRHRRTRSRSRSRDRQRRSHSRRSDSYDRRRPDKRQDTNLETIREENIQSNAVKNPFRSNNDDSYDSSNYGSHLDSLPLPNTKSSQGNINNSNTFGCDFDPDDPIDKARIHRQMEEKLRQALAREGKVYPPPKPEASHPVFANDGSFLEIFKKMQEAQQAPISATSVSSLPTLASTSVVAKPIVAAPVAPAKPPPPPVLPIMGRRRGGKILKTGIVEKPKPQAAPSSDSKDFWSLYLAEVNKYKSHGCESNSIQRPLLK